MDGSGVMTEVILQAQQLRKQYGPFTALHGIDLQLNKGEVVGFLDQMVPAKQPPWTSLRRSGTQ